MRRVTPVLLTIVAVLATARCSNRESVGGVGGSAGAGGSAAGSGGRTTSSSGAGAATIGDASGSAGTGVAGAGAAGAPEAGGTGGGGASGGPGAGGGPGGVGSGGSAAETGDVATCVATTLRAAAACTGRLFGAALAASHLSEAGYATAARELGFVTPENEMKWDQIEPTRGVFNFGPADQIVTFATQNAMKIKGHTLVWHKQLPAWVTSLTSASDIRAAMLDHINGVMSHYRGRVTAWDVVNEAWLTDGDAGAGTATIRDSVFSSALGPSFIDEAFTAARQADPAALLIYNEFANEGLSAKSTAVYEMIRDMKSRGVPIDGVGLQMHVGFNTAPTAADVATNMQRFADLGIKVFISEMDVNGCAGYSLEQERTQYHDMVAACVAQPACAAVTVWGITDKFSWLDTDTRTGCAAGQLPLPLLWDDNYVKKAAYSGALNALLGR